MQFNLVTDRGQSLTGFSSLKETFTHGAQLFPTHNVGWPSSSDKFDVYWLPDPKIWGVFENKPPKENGRRFWICFGVDDPAKEAMLSITVEINPSHEGVNRQVGGAFLRDNQGCLYLAHTGKVGGGYEGVGPSAFLRFYTEGERVFVPERGTELIVLGRVDDPDMCRRLASYVKEVARFKEHVRSATPSVLELAHP